MLLPYVQTTATATHDTDGDPSNVTRGVCIMTIDVGFPGADDAADAHERPLLRSGLFFYRACLGPPAVGVAASSTAGTGMRARPRSSCTDRGLTGAHRSRAVPPRAS